ncbi:putative receptor-like protein kinase [Platanthera zijinensis]|uniref:Receptor-like protein kinase n=1 Tax=Platanthera zijinensis TaxID=2320716 RepID=A0AAP0GC40_9ASPA
MFLTAGALLSFFLLLCLTRIHETQEATSSHKTASIKYVTDIGVGSNLSTDAAAASRLSPSGRFCFGFYSKGEGFLVGIRLIINSSASMVVWTAGPDLKPFTKYATLTFAADGFLLTPNSGTAIWASGTYGYNNRNLVLDEQGLVYLRNGLGGDKLISWYKPQNAQADMIYAAKLDADNIFRLYAVNLDANTSTYVSDIPNYKNKCYDPKTSCGVNSFCLVVNDATTCKCQPGFSFIPAGAERAGCQRIGVLPRCNTAGGVSMEKMEHVAGLDEFAYLVVSAATADDCSSQCLNDCDCHAIVFREQKCSKLRLPLSICLAVLAGCGGAYWLLFGRFREQWEKWELAFSEEIAPRYFDYKQLQGNAATRTAAVGTDGYIAPECLRGDEMSGTVLFTEKADVYSYGVVVLETVCGSRRNGSDGSDLCELARKCYDAELERMVRMGKEEVKESEIEKMVKIGILCVQEDPLVRPSMEDVVMMLEGDLDVPNPPPLALPEKSFHQRLPVRTE